MLPETEIDELIENPSLGAITYQSERLIREIRELDLSGQPSEIRNVRNLLLCLTDRVKRRLWELYDPKHPRSVVGGEEGFKRTRSLGRTLGHIHSFVRYICRDSFRKNSPSLHFIMNQLALRHVRDHENTPICIVRTKWHYRTECEPLSQQIQSMFNFWDFIDNIKDETVHLPPEQIITKWWKSWLDTLSESERTDLMPEDRPPLQISVLSFPGLDSQDVFLYPLLGHELGHFLDSSQHEALSRRIEENWPAEDENGSPEDESSFLSQTAFTDLYSDEPTTMPQVCVRELLADVLAVRIIGFSYFISLAEYLKTMYAGNGPLIETETGYPGMELRLWVILRHLNREGDEFNLRYLLDGAKLEDPIAYNFLTRYLAKWEKRLQGLLNSVTDPQTQLKATETEGGEDSTLHSVLTLVVDSLEAIDKVAIEAVPVASKLSMQTFKRIKALQQKEAPSLPDDDATSFGEIMAAVWIYEFMLGEPDEINMTNLEEQFAIYDETCRNAINAMDLIQEKASSGT